MFGAAGSVEPKKFYESEYAAEDGWERAIPEVRRWVTLNRPVLDEMQQAANCPGYLEFPLREVSTATFAVWEWASLLRQLAHVEALEAVRLSAEGRPADAWNRYRNILRTARLLSMHTTLIGSMSASAIGEMGVRGAVRWSSQRRVVARELRQAIEDMLSIEEMKTPNSDAIKIEYIYIRHSARHPSERWMRYTGYPAQLERSARLVVANLLSQVDRPRYLRTPVHPGELGLFELDPKSPPSPSLLPVDEVEQSTITSAGTMSKAVKWVSNEAASAIELSDPAVQLRYLYAAYLTQDLFQTRRGGLLLVLALQLHRREHASFPASLAELVTKGYLKTIPIDPFGKGDPFSYRLEPGSHAAVVWSSNGRSDCEFRVPAPAAKAPPVK